MLSLLETYTISNFPLLTCFSIRLLIREGRTKEYALCLCSYMKNHYVLSPQILIIGREHCQGLLYGSVIRLLTVKPEFGRKKELTSTSSPTSTHTHRRN